MSNILWVDAACQSDAALTLPQRSLTGVHGGAAFQVPRALQEPLLPLGDVRAAAGWRDSRGPRPRRFLADDRGHGGVSRRLVRDHVKSALICGDDRGRDGELRLRAQAVSGAGGGKVPTCEDDHDLDEAFRLLLRVQTLTPLGDRVRMAPTCADDHDLDGGELQLLVQVLRKAGVGPAPIYEDARDRGAASLLRVPVTALQFRGQGRRQLQSSGGKGVRVEVVRAGAPRLWTEGCGAHEGRRRDLRWRWRCLPSGDGRGGVRGWTSLPSSGYLRSLAGVRVRDAAKVPHPQQRPARGGVQTAHAASGPRQ